MSEETFFHYLLTGWFVLSAVVFVVLFFIAAPYGRHIRRGWGPSVSPRIGWIAMEAASPLLFALFFILGEHNETIPLFVLFSLWEAHYIHRAFIYPFTLSGQSRPMPVSVIFLGFIFNVVNAYLNGRYLFTLSNGYPNEWLVDPRFILGLALFLLGYGINKQADRTLRSLGKGNDGDYKIPHGYLYRWISCPNYFGEILLWCGWAIATWSPAGLAFAVWTLANLAPRARAHHQWYREHFPDYPQERKALIPLIW